MMRNLLRYTTNINLKVQLNLGNTTRIGFNYNVRTNELHTSEKYSQNWGGSVMAPNYKGMDNTF